MPLARARARKGEDVTRSEIACHKSIDHSNIYRMFRELGQSLLLWISFTDGEPLAASKELVRPMSAHAGIWTHDHRDKDATAELLSICRARSLSEAWANAASCAARTQLSRNISFFFLINREME